MSLKTSFFNKTLVKSDFKRLWWVPVLHTLALFLTGTFPYLQRYQWNSENVTDLATTLLYSDIYRAHLPAFVLGLIAPVLLATLLFSYLQSGKASTFAHSVPVSRSGAFVSHCISGIVMFIIPVLVNCAVFLLMRTDPDFASTFYVSHLFASCGIALLYSLVAFSLAVLVAMICGNAIANIIFTYVFGMLPLAAEVFVSYFAETQLHGYVLDTNYWCTQHLYLVDKDIMSAGAVILYIALSIVFLTGAYLVYRIRNMENHSEVVAFPALRPVFVFGVAICSGAFGYSYIQSLFDINTIWAMLPFGIIGLIIAIMIVRKSFRKLGVIKPIIIYSALVVCLFGIFGFDLTGFEQRVPDVEDVEYVTFAISGVNPDRDGNYYDMDGRTYRYDNVFSPDISNPDEIAAVTEAHKFLSKTEGAQIFDYRTATITYKKKDGKILKRRYRVDFDKYQEILEPVITTDTMRKLFFPVLRENFGEYIGVAVNDVRVENGELVPLSYDKVVIDEFVSALKTDTQNAPYSEFANRGSTFTHVMLSYKRGAHYDDGEVVPTEKIGEQAATYYVRSSYVNTLAVIEKYKLKVSVPQASDIEAIGIDYYGMDARERVTLQKLGEQKFSDRMYPYIVENPEDIAQIYEYCCNNGGESSIDMNLEFLLKDGRSFYCELNSQSGDLPKALMEIIKPLE